MAQHDFLAARSIIIFYRLFLGGLTLFAIATQLLHIAGRSNFNPLNFFSFFTIESNILAATVFILSALIITTKTKVRYHHVLRGAATVYMATTGIVYMLLLSGNENALQTTIPWVNTVLHYIMPIALFIDWLLDPPKRLLTIKQMFSWLIFPVIYLIYSLVRGPFVNWYPYPFLDPRIGGYGRIVMFSIAIAIGVLAVAMLVKILGNFQARRLRGKPIYNFNPEGL